jgi:hypothetical protein
MANPESAVVDVGDSGAVVGGLVFGGDVVVGATCGPGVIGRATGCRVERHPVARVTKASAAMTAVVDLFIPFARLLLALSGKASSEIWSSADNIWALGDNPAGLRPFKRRDTHPWLMTDGHQPRNEGAARDFDPWTSW